MADLTLELNASMGCLFIGVALSVAFYGTLCAQLLYYCWNYRSDARTLKLWVFAMWLVYRYVILLAKL
ncbi:hypothetical protein EVJ58_g1429 [Rhodofomes roseus]|uniref:Uncharacterized protein n=1 Tax=Rhodofomes roseus TaxID=34475 RepID=A0A4Y9Z142_9APHY|nr:hypothetical protein EVJ58_g1429 [Rhodofomes roseus]